MIEPPLPKVLAFDVFGTLVDWRSGIAAESRVFLDRIGRHDVDAGHFADGWRFRYLIMMLNFGASGRGFAPLDVLHREMLCETLVAEGIDPAGLAETLLQDWTFAWRRLSPWPDAVEGVKRLNRSLPVVTLSNANIALMMALSRQAGLTWDAILGAELTHAYKPDARAYLGVVDLLGLRPDELCLVAAHHADLAAARACGLGTAHISRPAEYGGRPAPDAGAAQVWDWSAHSVTELAAQFGCS